jgi:DNA-binding transcriptional regulator YbjK
VAEEGEVPLAATTYYFSSKDELMEEALRKIAGEEVERLSKRAEELLAAGEGEDLTADKLADLLADALRGEEQGELPKFEIYLEAARRPGLRAACAHWLEAFCELGEAALRVAGADDPAGAARVLVAGVDGMLVHRLARGERPYPDPAMREDLRRLVRGLLATA